MAVKVTFRILRHNIGECAATVDPKFPCHNLLPFALQQEGCKHGEGQELWPKSQALRASFA